MSWIEYGLGTVTTIATVFMAIFTGRLWISTNELWKSSEKQLKEFQDSGERELRAYVGVDEESKQDPPRLITFGGKLAFQPILTNYGRTPAYDLSVDYNVDLFPMNRKVNFQYPARPLKSVMTLFPGQHVEVLCTSERDIGLNEIHDRFKEGLVVLVYGTVKYQDAFKTNRQTNFCYEIKWYGQRILGWHVTEDHNDST